MSVIDCEVIAKWVTEIGLEYTTSGSYCCFFSEIAEKFTISEKWIEEHIMEIKKCFDFNIIAECNVVDKSFEITFYLKYCCEHCNVYLKGQRCYEKCAYNCGCWDDDFKQ